MKYTNQGFVKILAFFNDFSTIEISVEDSGTGIDEKDLEILFSAFTKIQKNRENNKEGCGLGLTISKNLAVALGGDIKVES